MNGAFEFQHRQFTYHGEPCEVAFFRQQPALQRHLTEHVLNPTELWTSLLPYAPIAEACDALRSGRQVPQALIVQLYEEFVELLAEEIAWSLEHPLHLHIQRTENRSRRLERVDLVTPRGIVAVLSVDSLEPAHVVTAYRVGYPNGPQSDEAFHAEAVRQLRRRFPGLKLWATREAHQRVDGGNVLAIERLHKICTSETWSARP